MGTDGWLYRLLVALSGITLILVVVNIVVIRDNRSIQPEVNQRQQFINQSIQFGRINDALVRAVATAALHSKDDKLLDLLAQNGFTINPKTSRPLHRFPSVASAKSPFADRENLSGIYPVHNVRYLSGSDPEQPPSPFLSPQWAPMGERVA